MEPQIIRPVMRADLFKAAIQGNRDVLIPRLGLQPEEGTEIQVTIETSHSAPERIEHQIVQSELQSATPLGDTVLHLLVTRRHNELVFKVLQRDISMLKVQNKKLETPLHCAAKVGNEEVIHNLNRIDHVVVKDALEETNENGDTTLHVAAQHGHKNVGGELMKLDPKLAYKVNKERSTPLYIAIVNGYTEMVKTMLELDPTLTCTQFSDEMFPVHVAARIGNTELVIHFMKKYPDDVELLDPRGRNIFHIAAEEKQNNFFWYIFKDTSVREMITRMNNATDYEGNTPLHIAAMKGHKLIMQYTWENMMNYFAETVRNNQGLTPLQLSATQLLETNEAIFDEKIDEYFKKENYKFTSKWFDDVMELSVTNIWEKAQVIGLGSVLITTITFAAFAAVFAIPGGYNKDNSTPLVDYYFRAFIVANAMAFIQGFLSLFALLARAMTGPPVSVLNFAITLFMSASTNMVLAFGSGLYVVLSPVCSPTANFFLLITSLLGSPVVLVVGAVRQRYFRDKNLIPRLAAHSVSFVLIYILSNPFALFIHIMKNFHQDDDDGT